MRFAKSLAISACGLLWAHYLLLDWTGRAGLLGLGTTVWFLAAAIGMLQRSAAEKCREHCPPVNAAVSRRRIRAA